MSETFNEGERVLVSLSRPTKTTRKVAVQDGDVCYVVRIAGKTAILKIDPGCPDIRGTLKVPVSDIRRWAA